MKQCLSVATFVATRNVATYGMLTSTGTAMPGRVDNATHALAVAKAGDVIRYAPELRQHLQEIISGPAFKVSRRSQEFLQYIVERSLRGECEDLRERTLGIELFGRPAGYDTGEDAIVRVTASDVRKRLLQHYGKAESTCRFRIELPSGSYVPEFKRVAVEEPVGAEEPTAANESPAGAAGAKTARKSSWAVRSAAALFVVLVASILWWPVRGRSRETSHETSRDLLHSTSGAADNIVSRAFGGNLGGNPGGMQVVVSDDGLLLMEVLLDRRFTLQEYENLKFLSTPEIVQRKGLERFWQDLSTRQVTNFGNVQDSHRIAESMRARNWNVVIRNARQVNARDFQSGNFIILGSAHANPWATLFEAPNTNFPMEPGPLSRAATILNLHPLAGEPGRFEVHTDPKTGKTITYARVSLVDNVTRTGRVLLVAGQSMSSTELAGEFLLRSESVAKALQKLGLAGSSPLPNLEMILRVTELNESGDSIELISCRKISNNTD